MRYTLFEVEVDTNEQCSLGFWERSIDLAVLQIACDYYFLMLT